MASPSSEPLENEWEEDLRPAHVPGIFLSKLDQALGLVGACHGIQEGRGNGGETAIQ